MRLFLVLAFAVSIATAKDSFSHVLENVRKYWNNPVAFSPGRPMQKRSVVKNDEWGTLADYLDDGDFQGLGEFL
ncbi:Oidioi.mRNA.OKI2018_I69.chr1.g1996.t1.cds [Oikopleura dioica]|uniref:Oidioi.mRNA.OKI2018_I69.chr1.g1996.t1.cds n=1 Tax=Oikopleura dioica TaxID=34765 RepID=A0ABN7SRE3_OIKDI|nr:Oidioi.mRNA.OKI2018_I69.chr1.g1996.t1.cds [Oikopleura dioica]